MANASCSRGFSHHLLVAGVHRGHQDIILQSLAEAVMIPDLAIRAITHVSNLCPQEAVPGIHQGHEYNGDNPLLVVVGELLYCYVP